MTAPVLVGLAGGSCAGKTTLAKLIRKRLRPTDSAIVAADRYYRPLDHLAREKRSLENFDSPGMVDRDLLEEHLALLKAGKPAGLPVYDFRLHTRSEKTERLDPPPVIIIEGIFLLADPGLRRFFDLAVFVETREAVRLARRLRRDREERGRTEEEILERYFAEVRPAHREIIAPSREKADLTVRGEGNLEKAAGTVAGRIAGLLPRAAARPEGKQAPAY